MKIKNIMFSGFTAVILAGVCGASNAATVSLISKNYADTNLQAKLTQGENITISEDNTISAVIPDAVVDSTELKAVEDALKAAIEEKQAKGDYLTAESLTELNNAVTALQSGKADVSTVTALQNAINGLGETYATKADMSAADTALQNAIDAIDLTPYAKTADVYSKTDADAKFMIMNNADALGANLQWTNEGKLDTKGIATAEGLEKLEERVNGNAQTQGSVAYDIAQAVESAKQYTDSVAYDDTAIKADVAVNTADIAEIKGAGYQDADDVKATVEGYGYQTADQVSGAITTATADLASKSYVDTAIAGIDEYDDTAIKADVATNTAAIADNKSAIEALEGAGYQTADNVKTTVEGYGYQTAEQVSGAITTATADLATKADTLAGYGITDAYTKSEVDSAIGAIKEYDDTALAGRVTVNEGAIADNAGAITALETTVGDADSGLVKGVADNASAIEALQGAGYVVGTKTAGSYLVNFDANGNASYAAVEILDDKGAPIDLTVGAVK